MNVDEMWGVTSKNWLDIAGDPDHVTLELGLGWQLSWWQLIIIVDKPEHFAQTWFSWFKNSKPGFRIYIVTVKKCKRKNLNLK